MVGVVSPPKTRKVSTAPAPSYISKWKGHIFNQGLKTKSQNLQETTQFM